MTDAPDDPFDLARFLHAQEHDYAPALAELRAGRKTTHWIWYVLPQLRDLGRSPRARFYGIGSLAEASAYLAHPTLGTRLRECIAAMNALGAADPVTVLGPVDAAKFRSCLTLFLAVAPEDPVLRTALTKFYRGASDERTLALLGA
ncbi:MAG: DUF1810 domain-containing protein [Burkholderiales bacterium]|nr:DUF1810 domain-containing protein [Burkholderiales bacterium]